MRGSVKGAEVHSLILGFYYAHILCDQLTEMLHRDVDIDVFLDSRTILDVIAKDSGTSERRLQIDILSLREIYGNGELKHLSWIPGK